MVDSPQNLYAKHLRQSFGYPLRFPEPKPGLPSSHTENGLHIGDVGYVNDIGIFMVLFNICLPSDHDLHLARREDLAGLVGLTQFDPSQVPVVPEGISTGRAVCHGVQGSQGDNLKVAQGVPYKFMSCSTSGAILVLPSGAVCQRLEESMEEAFRKLAEKCAVDWCRVAGCKSLYLLIGFYKARSWHLASFHDVSPTERVILERDDAGRYIWDSHCDYRKSPEENQSENQTVFISGFKIEVREWDKHTQTLVEKLLPYPTRRSIWFEATLWASFMVNILISICQEMISKIILSLCTHKNESARVGRVPALLQPFHPSDIINHFLLKKNHDVDVAITHDSEWLSMIEKDELSFEDMVDKGLFLAYLEENYTDSPNSDNVVYLQRKMVAPSSKHECGPSRLNRGETNGIGDNLYKSALSTKMFSAPTISEDGRQFVVTGMRAQNIVARLRRLPVGFYVVIQCHGAWKRSECKPVSLCHDMVEWDDKIVLPTDPTDRIQFSIIASFEFEPLLGNGEVVCMSEISASELAEGATHFLSSFGGHYTPCRTSLLVTTEERVDTFQASYLGLGNYNWGCKKHPCMTTEITDKGHSALLRYHQGEGIEPLQESATCFRLALDLCPPMHEDHAPALFNHAMATFLFCQAHGTISDLYVAIHSYRGALVLRPGRHPDRPRTLLHLAQALLYLQGWQQYEPSVRDEIEDLAKEIKQICIESSYDYRGADLILQTLRRFRIVASGTLAELDDLILELDWSTRIPSDWHGDRSCRFINLSAALHRRFEISGNLYHLKKMILTLEETERWIADDRVDKPWVLACLGVAFCARFVQHGDVTDLEKSISTIEDALKFAPDNHYNKPWMLASLGNTLLLRFEQCGNPVDLNHSISTIVKAAKLSTKGFLRLPWILFSLSNALRMRFVQSGKLVSLKKSISLIPESMKLCSAWTAENSFNKLWRLASLGDGVRMRFERCGYGPDLHNAIMVTEEAIRLVEDSHLQKPFLLASLGDALFARFMQYGHTADLENAIRTIKNAIQLSPNGYSGKPHMVTSLGNSLHIRFISRGDVGDLQDATLTLEQALTILPRKHVDMPWALALLGDVYRTRFELQGRMADIRYSVRAIEHAVEHVPDGYLYKPWMLVFLSKALRARAADVSDIERSVLMAEHAVKLASYDRREKLWVLLSDAVVLCRAYLPLGHDKHASIIKGAAKLAPEGYVYLPWLLASDPLIRASVCSRTPARLSLHPMPID